MPRERFVSSEWIDEAYDDGPLPLGEGQTISQPFVHARSLELLGLTGTERALEIGTGSGYQTALLAQLARAVFSVERIPALYDKALAALDAAGVRNVTLQCADGTAGWAAHAPYDAIVVSAAFESIEPELAALGVPTFHVNRRRLPKEHALQKVEGYLQNNTAL